MKEVQEYERRVGGIILDPSAKQGTHHFSVWHRQTISPKYAETFQKKSLLYYTENPCLALGNPGNQCDK
jgi:hypothetical protein